MDEVIKHPLSLDIFVSMMDSHVDNFDWTDSTERDEAVKTLAVIQLLAKLEELRVPVPVEMQRQAMRVIVGYVTGAVMCDSCGEQVPWDAYWSGQHDCEGMSK